LQTSQFGTRALCHRQRAERGRKLTSVSAVSST